MAVRQAETRETTTPEERQFFGRAEELAALRAGLDAAEDGRPPVMVLHGENGVGKTRTAEQFAEEARDRGALVLWGSCHEEGGALPYGPWGEAIDRFLAGLEPEERSDLVGPDAHVLAALTPRIEAGAGNGLGTSANGDRVHELAGALARFLDALDSPLAVVLDDLQWASLPSLDMFSYVARSAATPMMVAIYEGRELDIGYPLARCLGEVNRHRACQYLRLAGLSLREATGLLQDVTGAAVEPRAVEAMHHASNGNPFLLTELGRHLEARAGLPGIAEWQPPEAIRQAVALRLADLSIPTRDVLERASILPRGFTFEDLGLLIDLEEEALLLSVEEALAADAIRPVRGERYEFAHAILGYTLYSGLSPSRRVRLHRRLAEGLERMHEGRTSEVASTLARQYHGSATLPGAERGIDYAITASAQARLAHVPAEAVEFARMAIDLTPSEDTPTRAEVLGQLAVVLAEAGMLEDALRSLEAALPLLTSEDATPQDVASLVYNVVLRLGVTYPRDAALRPFVNQGLNALGDDHDLTWARLKLLERPQEVGAGRGAAGPSWAGFDREAVSIARAEGSEDDYVMSIDWYAPMSPGHLATLLPHVEAARDPGVKLRGLIGLTHHLLLAEGVTPLVERLAGELEALARELASPGAIALATTQRAAILGERGDLDGAAAAIAEAEELAKGLDSSGQIAAAAFLIRELSAQHVAPDWRSLAEEMERMAASEPPVLWGIACASFAGYAFARAGMSSDAEATLARVVPPLAVRQPGDFPQSLAVGLAAAAAWELRSGRFAEQLLPAALALIEAGVPDWYMTSNELSVARLATVLGRFEQAAEYFDRARAKLSGRGQQPLLAIVDFDEASARRSSRQPGAARLFTSAKTAFAELGMEAWARRAALEDAATELPDDLTPREAEVLRLLATGLTNNEIAAELVLSVHTVERHLTNSYRKIDVRNRADATAYVVRNDL